MPEVKTTGDAVKTIIDALTPLAVDERKKVMEMAAVYCREKRGPKKNSKQATLPGTDNA